MRDMTGRTMAKPAAMAEHTDDLGPQSTGRMLVLPRRHVVEEAHSGMRRWSGPAGQRRVECFENRTMSWGSGAESRQGQGRGCALCVVGCNGGVLMQAAGMATGARREGVDDSANVFRWSRGVSGSRYWVLWFRERRQRCSARLSLPSNCVVYSIRDEGRRACR